MCPPTTHGGQLWGGWVPAKLQPIPWQVRLLQHHHHHHHHPRPGSLGSLRVVDVVPVTRAVKGGGGGGGLRQGLQRPPPPTNLLPPLGPAAPGAMVPGMNQFREGNPIQAATAVQPKLCPIRRSGVRSGGLAAFRSSGLVWLRVAQLCESRVLQGPRNADRGPGGCNGLAEPRGATRCCCQAWGLNGTPAAHLIAEGWIEREGGRAEGVASAVRHTGSSLRVQNRFYSLLHIHNAQNSTMP